MGRQNQEVDPEGIPLLSMLFGYGPMLPIAFGGLLAIIDPDFAHSPFVALVVLWAAAILMFVAGVRRATALRARSTLRSAR
jgi:hypothetical protein